MTRILADEGARQLLAEGGCGADLREDLGESVDVSVVIPSINRAGMVERAVESVLSEPGRMALEAIVVDDGSTDDTLSRLSGYDDRLAVLAFGRNRGRNHARNAGRSAARGEWVKFLDSDDVLEPGALLQELEAGREANAGIVVTSWRVGKPDGSDATVFPVPHFDLGVDSLLEGNAVPTSAALYRRALIAKLDWDTSLKKLDDWDFFVQAYLRASRVISLPLVSYTWVTHGGQVTRHTAPLTNALSHHAILRKLEGSLRTNGLLTEARKRRLAQYYYKELRVLSLFDRAAFEKAAAHILELDAKFQPRDELREEWMKALSRFVGFRRAVLLHSAVKRALRGRLSLVPVGGSA